MGIRMGRFAILLAVTLWGLAVRPAWSGTCLALTGEEPERTIVTLPIAAGAIFHLEFINSIYLAKVRESFVFNPEDGIFLVSVESPSHGVFEYYGLIPDAMGRVRLNRPIGEIRLKSHDYEHHLLIIGDEQIHLKTCMANGKALIIRVLMGERCQP